ncbi:MAG: hypothetical protein ROO73_04965 [Roseivirga sp.]
MQYQGKILVQLRVTGMLVGYLLPYTVQAQNLHGRKNTDDHYFLNNFKCSVEVGANVDFNKSYDRKQQVYPNYGLGFGYYLLRYKHEQLGVVKKSALSYETVKFESGEAFFSVETGIRYPEKFMFKSFSFSISESYLAFPLVLRWALPNFFAGGTYTSLFLGYNVKCLLKAHYTPPKEPLGYLNADFLDEISNLKDHIAEIKTLTHSVSIGGGYLTPWGVYLDVAFDFPLGTPNDSIYLNNICKRPPQNESTGKLLERSRILIHLGLDIVRVLRSFKGMHDDNTPTRIRSTQY